MKKLTLIASLLAIVFCVVSCKPDSKDSYKKFVGKWGVERLEYYIIDYAGDPIPNTVEVHEFTLNDPHDGIDLIFRDSKKGEMYRRDIDTFYVQISLDPVEFDTIINPDTTVVIPFDYTYDDDESTLIMKMLDDMSTFMMVVSNFSENSFTYVNEYKANKVEKAFLKRISDAVRSQKSASKPTYRPRKPGSFMSN